jgi:Thaumatin family
LPPATLFEITLGKGTDEDFYDVSLVDGYNLPVVVIPRVEHSACNATGCIADLNQGDRLTYNQIYITVINIITYACP